MELFLKIGAGEENGRKSNRIRDCYDPGKVSLIAINETVSFSYSAI